MPSQKRLVEVCVDSVESAVNAAAAGADRLEVCQNLELGGTTPSYGLLKAILNAVNLPVVVMIRPRAGDFCYGAREFDVMLRDVELIKTLPISAVVTGILLPDGQIDKVRMAQIIDLAKPLNVVLHRAFDMTRDLNQALDDAVALGVVRILTSGGAPDVRRGMASLGALFNRQKNIEIMPGAGVDGAVIDDLIALGARQIHLSGKRIVDGAMRYQKPTVKMSAGVALGDYRRQITDRSKVSAVVRAFKSDD